MSRRAAFTYLVVAFLLGCGYFLATRWEEQKAGQETLENRAFDLKKEDVAALKVLRAGEPEILIARANGNGEPASGGKGRWQITAPRALAANQSAVVAVIEAMVETERLRTLEGSVPDAAEYGLDAPALRVSVEAGGKWHTIAFGEENLTRNARYARLAGAEEIFLVAAYAFNRMDRGLEGLRDRRLLPIARSAIRAITLAHEEKRFTLRRKDGAWRFEDNPRPVSETAVDGLIGVLTETEVERFVTEEETDLAPYGLDAPEVSVTFELGNATNWVRLRRAAEDAPEQGVLAARSNAPGVVTLMSGFIDRIPESAAEMEDKILFRGEIADAHAVSLSSAGAKASFTREGDTWQRKDGTTENADDEEEAPDVEGLLTLLQDLRHEGAPPEGGRTPAQFEVTLRIASRDGTVLLTLAISPAEAEGAPRRARLTDADGEREVNISIYTVENFYDQLRLLSPGLLPSPKNDATGDD